MGIYSVGGRSVATAATVNHGSAILWNPHTTKRIWLLGIEYVTSAAVGILGQFSRTSTKGTPGSTITPDEDNSWERDIAPPSGAVLDLATYTVQPTLQGPAIYKVRVTSTIGFGGMWAPPEPGVCIPPGTGFGVLTAENNAFGAVDYTFIWEERD